MRSGSNRASVSSSSAMVSSISTSRPTARTMRLSSSSPKRSVVSFTGAILHQAEDQASCEVEAFAHGALDNAEPPVGDRLLQQGVILGGARHGDQPIEQVGGVRLAVEMHLCQETNQVTEVLPAEDAAERKEGVVEAWLERR